MALSASTTLPHGVDSVTAVFTNEDFQRHTSEHVGGSLESFTVDGDLAGAFSTTSVRTLPTTRLPEIARKFVGDTLKVAVAAPPLAPYDPVVNDFASMLAHAYRRPQNAITGVIDVSNRPTGR